MGQRGEAGGHVWIKPGHKTGHLPTWETWARLNKEEEVEGEKEEEEEEEERYSYFGAELRESCVWSWTSCGWAATPSTKNWN